MPQEVDIPAPVNTTRCLLCKTQTITTNINKIEPTSGSSKAFGLFDAQTFRIINASCSVCQENQYRKEVELA